MFCVALLWSTTILFKKTRIFTFFFSAGWTDRISTSCPHRASVRTVSHTFCRPRRSVPVGLACNLHTGKFAENHVFLCLCWSNASLTSAQTHRFPDGGHENMPKLGSHGTPWQSLEEESAGTTVLRCPGQCHREPQSTAIIAPCGSQNQSNPWSCVAVRPRDQPCQGRHLGQVDLTTSKDDFRIGDKKCPPQYRPRKDRSRYLQ